MLSLMHSVGQCGQWQVTEGHGRRELSSLLRGKKVGAGNSSFFVFWLGSTLSNKLSNNMGSHCFSFSGTSTCVF